MKDPTLDWLLEPSNPSVRLQALTDLLRRSREDEDVQAAQNKIAGSRPVKKILSTQTSRGYWPPKEDCYRPKWTAAVWPLALLSELGASPDPRVKRSSSSSQSGDLMGPGMWKATGTTRETTSTLAAKAERHQSQSKRVENPASGSPSTATGS